MYVLASHCCSIRNFAENNTLKIRDCDLWGLQKKCSSFRNHQVEFDFLFFLAFKHKMLETRAHSLLPHPPSFRRLHPQRQTFRDSDRSTWFRPLTERRKNDSSHPKIHPCPRLGRWMDVVCILEARELCGRVEMTRETHNHFLGVQTLLK